MRMPDERSFPTARLARAPVLTLFFIWRLRSKPAHPYSLIQDIRSAGFQQFKPSTIYALLEAMEKAGLLKSRYATAGGRSRRLYGTTEKGWKTLSMFKKTRVKGLWRQFMEFMLS